LLGWKRYQLAEESGIAEESGEKQKTTVSFSALLLRVQSI
jgi:hypothetical protein